MADQRILWTEEMVGAGHPSKSDTLNRLSLVSLNSDGTHKYIWNVKEYGAKGDGTTDDYAVIQAIINAMDATYGGILFFPPGLYLLTSPLALSDSHENIAIIGSGPHSSWLYVDGTDDNAVTITGQVDSYASGITIRDIGISRNSTSPTSGIGIAIQYGSHILIENIIIYHQTYGIQLNGVSQTYIKNIWITRTAGSDETVGIRIDGSIANPSVLVSKAIMNFSGHSSVSYAVTVTGADTRDIRLDWIEGNNLDYGIYAQCTNDDPHSYSLDLHITNPIFDQVTERGITLSSIHNANVEGGWILMADKGDWNYGMFLDNARYSKFHGIQIYGGINASYVDGILTSSACINNSFTENQFYGCEYGMVLQTTAAQYNLITNNVFTSCVNTIYDAGSNNMIHHNIGIAT